MWETIDNQVVDERFQMLATTNFTSPQRTMGNWYTAYCPIVSPAGHLGMSDYFGRTMVAALPANVKVGVVAVAMGGSPIEMFDKDLYQQKMADNPSEWWVTLANNYYGGNPYGRLVEMGKKAQQSGVIKGILLHQGCSNNGDPSWPGKVKKIYNDLLADLGLNAADVPLLVGETERADMGGGCAAHNAVVAKVPEVIPTAHVVSSEGIPGNGQDAWHFSAAGYRTFGKRYAYEMLRAYGLATKKDAAYTLPSNLTNFYKLTKLNDIEPIKMRVGATKQITVRGTFADGHEEVLTADATFSSSDFSVSSKGVVTATAGKTGIVTVSYTDFIGNTLTTTVTVEANDMGPNHALVVNNGAAGTNLWDKQLHCELLTPMTKGKTYIVKASIKADNSGDCALWPIWKASPNRDQWQNSADVQYLSSYALNSEFKEFAWEFAASYTHDCLQFAFGQIGGKVYFDNVSCVEKGTTTEMISNGDFESDDISKWTVLGYTGQSLSIEEIATTGIDRPSSLAMPSSSTYYDLAGHRLNGKPSKKGLYIVGGKKIIVH